MIEPIFKFVDENHIKILDKNTGREIGQIFSPADTIAGKESAIQVCGFGHACQLWGCGVYTTIDKEANVIAKQDIQLLFDTLPTYSDNTLQVNVHALRNEGINNCDKCYSKPCRCDQLKLKNHAEYVLEKI